MAGGLNYNDSLRNSFIFDSQATVHVCNDRSRFRNLRAAGPEETLTTGSPVIQIQAFGSVDIVLAPPIDL